MLGMLSCSHQCLLVFYFRREWFFILVQNCSKQIIKCIQISATGKEFSSSWGMGTI